MLPIELLVVQRWKDSVRPRYSKLSERDVSAAEAVIKAYRESIGLKKEVIREKISELEDAYGNYRFIRGLATLVERKCIFVSNASVDPLTVRHAIFAEVAKKGYPITLEERQKIVETVASALKVSLDQIETSMYADLDSEMILKSISSVNSVDLLKMYNLSLTQTLLFRSTEMSFTAKGNLQKIFRAIKFHGLMYTVYKRGSDFAIRLDGPTSLFKLTKRYGTAFAKVLTEIIRGKPWKIEAKILRENRLLNFMLESEKHGWLFPELLAEETYDSAVEAEFAMRFRNLSTPWTLIREAELVETGTSVMIPDFTFQLGETRVMMEIVGFWTNDYLKRKLEKLTEIRGVPFIVAVDPELTCEKFSRLQFSNPNICVLYFKKRIPVKDVLNLLQPFVEAVVNTQAESVKLVVRKPIVTLKELAKVHGVMVEAVRRSAKKIETHVLIGEALVEKKLLENIRQTLETTIVDEAPLTKVLKVLEPYGLLDPVAVKIYFGYEIKWRALSPENATVYKTKTS